MRHADVQRDDVRQFAMTIAAHRDYFESDSDVFVARAPGRLDLMGGIADYSGSLVLELPLAAATLVAAQIVQEAAVTVRSLVAGTFGSEAEVSVPLSVIAPVGQTIDYDAARSLFSHDQKRRWAAYALGALVVLGRERGLRLDRGVRLLIDSAVPAGKGVASSAAIEVAAMQALCAAYNVKLSGPELGVLSQKVENLVVGAPCGVMDQMTSACGEENQLLALLCQPAHIVGHVSLPPGLEVWGIDSGLRHEIGGTDYAAVRVGAFMGYRIIADIAGLAVTAAHDGHVAVSDERWNGYLANIGVDYWEKVFRERMPVSMRGAEFLERYGGITDGVTRVERDRTYAVRQPTEHPIREHARVQAYRQLLETGAATDAQRAALGDLMYASHASYSACGLGSSGTDRLVELVRESGRESGLYGAKITGGGSGGVVAVLAREGSHEIVDDIADRYARETGRVATVLGGSSPGAIVSGVVRLRS